MTNQTAQFTSSTDATLAVSVRRGQHDWVITVRQKTPGEKTLVGRKDYIELSKETEAQAAFDKRVKEALAAGWVQTAKAERAPAFTAIPQAPGTKPIVTGGAANPAPRAARSR